MDEKKRVLIIEDDKTTQLLLKTAFEQAGFRVMAALDAMQGVMSYRQFKPDLIVLDMMLPAGGGAVVYERLQMMSGAFELPVLVYTSLPREEALAKVPEGPKVRILSKSAKLPELIEAAKQLLEA